MLNEREVNNLLATARVYLDSARPHQAETQLMRVLEQQPDHYEAGLLLVFAYRDQGRISEGLAQARSLLGKGDNGQVYAIIADCYYARIQIPEAAYYYEKALAYNPFCVDWLAQLILIYYENEQPGQALKVMDQAARLDPQHYLLWHNMYLFFHRMESNTVMENQALCHLADSALPRNRFYLYQAFTAEKEGRRSTAYELYKKAFLADPTDQNVKWQLSNFERKQGRG